MKYFIALCTILLLAACQESSKNISSDVEKSEFIKLKSKLTELEQERDSLQLLVDNNQGAKQDSWFGTMESKSFKDLGIENPNSYISKALEENSSAIPIDGVLGGTMFFTNIEILGSKWIVASYEDGHIMGRAIFTYIIDPETLEVEFEVLDQVMEY